LVEDNPDEARLMQKLFLETNKNVRLHVAHDGIEAMAFLRNQGPYINAPRPDVILLDLVMPKKDGYSVLSEIKAEPRLKYIPLIVLATSQSEFDIEQSYKLLASCYLAKPLDVMELVKSLNDFWLTRVSLQKKRETVTTDSKSAI
jgi:chemotaxis family two-component system response regulator Rcp1